ncbi:MAG: ABC transporter ATP-binding protein/permease [Acetobacter sp.]|nr:ABC transporter ATP-binding protein/permease [Bacteroides sp.]MCM1340346.1 ABC transporter ATP-binding protein/permease [Acetobacter sp.]MCM1433007.1 ABC transporter ATP-binding protein/permease [Clostridiales bacterium]
MPPGPQAKGGFKKPKNAKRTFGRVLKYMGKSKAYLILVFVMLVLSTACSIGSSYCLKPILNGVETTLRAGTFLEEGVPLLVKNLALLTVLFVCASLFSFIQSRIMVSIAYKTTNIIRKDLFNHMQTLPLRYFDSQTHGEIMSRFTNDVDNIQLMLEQSMVQLVSSAFTFVGIVITMITLSPVLFGITLIFLVIMIFSVTQIGKKSRKYFSAQQKKLGEMNGNIEESIEGMKVVKVFNHESQAIEEFTQTNENFRQVATNANFFSGIMGPSSMGINNASYASVALVGGLLVMGGMDIGTFFAFLSYSRQFTQPINQIANQMNTIFSALAGAERVFAVMDMESEIDEGSVTLSEQKTENGREWYWIDGDQRIKVEGNVVFTDVNFSYVPEKQVLKNINLYAKKGQKIAFVGSTGAGKTTITNLVNRFYDIQDGTITYDGIDIKRIKKDDLRKSLAIVLQDTHMFTGTILDNIRYGRLDATDEECIEAAKLASAHSFIRRLPDGYNTKITGDGGNLSQGQRQLLAIARAAVADPPVMILDEATSSIDTRTELHIEHGMDRLMQGRTVFVIAHRLSTVRNSNAIMVLENGEIIERGDHDALIELKGRYYELCTGKAKLS